MKKPLHSAQLYVYFNGSIFLFITFYCQRQIILVYMELEKQKSKASSISQLFIIFLLCVIVCVCAIIVVIHASAMRIMDIKYLWSF